MIENDLAQGWVLEPPETQNIVAFEGNYFPEGGSTVQVEYHCRGGCK